MTPEQVHKHIKIINGEKVFDGNLDLSLENLTSLEPYNLSDVIVTGYFSCSYNNLTSLKGSPKQINGYFGCSYNKLTSLIGAPKQVNGGFICYNNNLTSLEGAPNEVGGGFICYNNNLTSLEGAPNEVGGDFICKNNNNLTSLEGLPEKIGGDIWIAKEVLQKLYFTNDLIALYDLQDKFRFL